MKINKFLSFLFLIIIASSCAKTPGKTDAKIKLKIGAMLDIAAVSSGGAMLWGRSDKGDMFGEVIGNNPLLQIELNNGQWMFWALSWEGDGTNQLVGKIRCAKTFANLNGPDVQLSLTLDNQFCKDPDFTPAYVDNAGEVGFPEVKHYECNKLNDHKGFACGKGALPTKTTSRRLIVMGFNKSAGGPYVPRGGLVSACTASSGSLGAAYVPTGNGKAPFYTTLQSFFSSTACDETDPKGFVKDNSEFGLLAPSGEGLNKIAYFTTGSCNGVSFSKEVCESFGGSYSASCSALPANFSTQVSKGACEANNGTYTDTTSRYIGLITSVPDEILCSGKRVLPGSSVPTIFSSGLGTQASPYSICTETQLNSINDNSPLLSAHFLLAADLDMNRTSLFGDQSPPACLSSDPGRNFNPIGGMYNGACSLINTPNSFTGIFDGNGHTISNIRFQDDDLDNAGFIRSGGTVKNLTLKNVEIEGNNKVSAFVGDSPVGLENLKVIGGKIKGAGYVGGIAGHSNISALSNLHVIDVYMKIRNTSYAIGGLIGKSLATPLNLSKSSFEGIIDLEYPTVKAGGLVGEGYGLYVSESYSSGAMLVSNTSKAGGLVGYSSGSLTFDNSYSKMSMGPANNSTGDGSKVGGLVGEHSSSILFKNSFYYGSMLFSCRDTTQVGCSISPLSSGAVSVAGTLDATSAGAVLYPAWYDSAYLTQVYNQDISLFEANIKGDVVGATDSAFVDIPGSVIPKLKWENGPCSEEINNRTVALQSVFRGSIERPIVICNKEQFMTIKNFPNQNFVIEDNINIGELSSNPALRIENFTGSIEGKNHIVGGFYHNAIGVSYAGLIQHNYGKISNVNFANAFMTITGTTTDSLGIVAVNESTGSIENNKFFSTNVLVGSADSQGIVAGKNHGKVFNNKVASSMTAQQTSGLIVGKNEATGVIIGSKVDGELTVSAANASVSFGGAVGRNLGKISEVDVGAAVKNNTNNNTSVYIGAFVGDNQGIAQDILVSSHAKMSVEIVGPKYGQVFGNISSTSTVKRIIAANEMPVNSTYDSASINSFGYSGASATYSNSYFMTKSVFNFNTSPSLILNSCSVVPSSSISYTFNSLTGKPAGYINEFYVPNAGSDHLTKRVSGSVVSNNVTATFAAGDFSVPCEAGGLYNGDNAYFIDPAPDFNISSEVHAVGPNVLMDFETYCPSKNTLMTAGTKPYYVCDLGMGEFDIAEAYSGGVGFDRLKEAYRAMVVDKQFISNRPIWTFDNNEKKYPRLFLAD